MKYLIFIVFFLTGLISYTQNPIDPSKIVSDTTYYSYSQSDSSWVEIREVEYYSGIGELTNTAVFNNQIGDTSVVTRSIVNLVQSSHLQQARALKQAFTEKSADRLFNELSTLYEAVSGESLFRGMSQRFISTYVPGSKFRIVCSDQNFTATLIEIPAGVNQGRLRLNSDSTSDLWLFNPKSNESFELQNMRAFFQSGKSGPIYFALAQENEKVKVYRPKDFISGAQATNTCLGTLRVIQTK